jgi:malate dehydrogenase (oxaloacetate-decarboxylating)(NADP+)
MKMAAALALAKLAREPVPPEVLQAYGLKTMTFGRESSSLPGNNLWNIHS